MTDSEIRQSGRLSPSTLVPIGMVAAMVVAVGSSTLWISTQLGTMDRSILTMDGRVSVIAEQVRSISIATDKKPSIDTVKTLIQESVRDHEKEMEPRIDKLQNENKALEERVRRLEGR